MSTLTITHDLGHLPAVKASALRLADARATLETIDQGSATAAERLDNVTSKLRSGDTTVTATQLRNAKDDVERFGYLHAGAANSARAATNAVVNEDTSIADAIAGHLQGDSHGQFPVNAVVGVNPPTAELVNPLRPMLYVQQTKPGKLSAGGYVTGECMVAFTHAPRWRRLPRNFPYFECFRRTTYCRLTLTTPTRPNLVAQPVRATASPPSTCSPNSHVAGWTGL